MKTVIECLIIFVIALAIVLAIFVDATNAQVTTVSGRVYQQTALGIKLPLSRTYVALYDSHGLQAATMTSTFGYYQLNVPNYDYYVLVATNRLFFFEQPAVIFNSAFDDGQGFHFDFVGVSNSAPIRGRPY